MIKKNDYYSSQATLISRFRIMGEKAKSYVLKTLILNDFFGEYIDNKVAGLLNKKSNLTEKEKNIYKEQLEKRTEEAVDAFIKDLLSDDKELKYRLFESFINNYELTTNLMRNDICKYNHNYSDWKEEEGKVPQYDSNGNFIGYNQGIFYERTCSYCGDRETAYSQNEKELLEKSFEQVKNLYGKKKRRIYVLNNKKEENSQ